MMSTGSPLSAESFDFVYEAIKPDIHLASISGGTDICGCFVGGNPLVSVWRGEIQGPMLGMAIDVLDDNGRPVKQEKGELVCTKPFPSMPVMFWNDPDGEKYHNAYFARFDNIWCHGDFAELTAHGGMIIHGRSDATLNPGGVRIGTAEIYAQVERIPEVLEALAIGQDWDNDVRVVLFVRLAPGVALDDKLIARIKKQVRDGASPRHVPAEILAVSGYSAHQIGQDHRTGGARSRPWPRGEEQGSAGQSRSARSVPESCGPHLKLSRIAEIAREQDDGDEARRNNGKCWCRTFFQLIERGQQKHQGCQRLEIKRPQDKRGRQLLHAIDKNQKRGRDKRRSQDGQMDFHDGAQRRAAQGARRKGEIGRHFLKAAFERAKGDGKKADGIGKDDRGNRAGEQKAGGDAKGAAHEGIDAIVEIGERNEHANAKHRSRHGIADTGKPEE